MRRAAYLLQLVFFLRVPLLGGVALVALALLGAGRLTTLANMMIMGSTLQLAISVFLAAALAAHCGLIATLIWCQGPSRFGADLPPPPAPLRSRNTLRGLVFLPVALPLVARLWWRNAFDLRDSNLGWPGATVAVAAGLAALGLMLWSIESWRLWLLHRQAVTGNRAEGWVFGLARAAARRLGPGFFEVGAGGHADVAPGHLGATVTALFLGALYALFYFVLDPGKGRQDLAPTVAYVLGLLLLLTSIFSFATFLVDRWRLPLLAAVALYVLAAGTFAPKDHFFTVRRGAEPPPDAAAAVAARRQLQEAHLPAERRPHLTVVLASGGGIQAAAWTARVLTGLQEEEGLGEDFTRSIHLISAVSGGSVGTMFFLEAFEPRRGAPARGRLPCVRQAAGTSSLEATAWGLVYPDFLRSFLPVVDRRRDRGWALEQAWLQAAEAIGVDGRRGGLEDSTSALAREARMLSAWRRGAAEGWLPAAVLNTTVVEDGQQLWLANVGFGGSVAPRSSGIGHTLEARYGSTGATTGTLDLPVATAARLSATFPYVTPLARAIDEEGSTAGLPGIHLADGGYFDNHGVVAALEWLLALCPGEIGSCPRLESFGRIFLVEISAFAQREPAPGPCGAEASRADGKEGWQLALSGPIEILLNVRNSSQRSRSALELELLRRQPAPDLLQHFVFRPPDEVEGERPSFGDAACDQLPVRQPPVSWSLSRTDLEALECAWKSPSTRRERERLREAFAGVAPLVPAEVPP